MSDDCVKHYELEWLQEQIWELERKVEELLELERKVEELQMENTLLRNDLNIIKNEGCWRYHERQQN